MGRQKVQAFGQLPVDGVEKPHLIIGEPEQTWDDIVRGRKGESGGLKAEDGPWRNCAERSHSIRPEEKFHRWKISGEGY
jgi:hypothetical protein